MVTNEYGCVDTSVQIIWVKPEIHIYIPNCFTPNGDGLNDVFIPKGMGLSEEGYKMVIFDRWGEQIFESTELTRGWDGKVKNTNVLAEQGVYAYKIYVKDVRGRAYEFVGHVTCLPLKEN
jgi:gliding motility-associated-like protein